MTNIGHFRAASKIWEDCTPSADCRTYIAPPTRMDQSVLKGEARYSSFVKIGARIETPGCSLCMGNQLRIPNDSVAYATSTRNFNNRLGNGCQVYLGSAELGAVVATVGKLPTPAEYMAVYNEKIAPNMEEIYNYMQFDEIDLEDSLYAQRDL